MRVVLAYFLLEDAWNFDGEPGINEENAESFPTVPWASANSLALGVYTFWYLHLLTMTVAGALSEPT